MSNIVRLTPQIPALVINENEVTVTRLASLLQSAVIDTQLDDDGDLYASDGLEFPCWVQIMQGKKLIAFSTFMGLEEDEGDDWSAQVNKMNTSIQGVQFQWAHNKIYGHHIISYDSGLNARQFVKMLRRFSSAFKAGIMLDQDEKTTCSCSAVSS